MSKWNLADQPAGGYSYIVKDGELFAASTTATKRLEEIVSTLNAHDDLVVALREIAKQPPHPLACREMAQAALEKAGVKL